MQHTAAIHDDTALICAGLAYRAIGDVGARRRLYAPKLERRRREFGFPRARSHAITAMRRAAPHSPHARPRSRLDAERNAAFRHRARAIGDARVRMPLFA